MRTQDIFLFKLQVVAVFSRGGVCERASIDEVYLDVTEAAVARLQQSPPDGEENLSPQVLGTHIVGLEEVVIHLFNHSISFNSIHLPNFKFQARRNSNQQERSNLCAAMLPIEWDACVSLRAHKGLREFLWEQDDDGRMEAKDWLCRSALFASKGDQLLACGAMIIAELRAAVFEETGFTTSAGIAHNKVPPVPFLSLTRVHFYFHHQFIISKE